VSAVGPERVSDPAGPDLRGLIVDFGGVMTTALSHTVSAWCAADGIDRRRFAEVMAEWLGEPAGAEAAANPVHALEMGRMAVPDFERELAERLRRPGDPPLAAEGMVARMFAASGPEPVMVEAVRRARAAGIATALLSNSWGLDYPRQGWDKLFTATVISGEVGLRKPDPRIYRLAAERVGLAPEQCVFVDDLHVNVRAAVEVGMVGVHHADPETTVAELEAIFGILLAG
jgi:putative hydrolase of the HAD superfamily